MLSVIVSSFFSERVLWKKNEVADGEATTFSIFYNNTLYLLLVLLSFYFWRALHPGVYPFIATVVDILGFYFIRNSGWVCCQYCGWG